jgi:hypothetical protein
MSRRVPYPDDEAVPVIVPRNDRSLVPTSPDRVRSLRKHLARLLSSMRDNEPASLVRTGPGGFQARVANAACELCRGWCCRGGGDDGFLDESTLARVPRSLVNSDEVVEMYVERVPDIVYENSCIFHGSEGCTLDRSMRSDTCNAYFCGGLHAYMESAEPEAPTIVIAAEGHDMRLSPVLEP